MIRVYFTDGTSKSVREQHIQMVPEGSWLLFTRGVRGKTILAVPAQNVKYVETE